MKRWLSPTYICLLLFLRIGKGNGICIYNFYTSLSWDWRRENGSSNHRLILNTLWAALSTGWHVLNLLMIYGSWNMMRIVVWFLFFQRLDLSLLIERRSRTWAFAPLAPMADAAVLERTWVAFVWAAGSTEPLPAGVRAAHGDLHGPQPLRWRKIKLWFD